MFRKLFKRNNLCLGAGMLHVCELECIICYVLQNRRSPVKTCDSYIPKRARFKEPLSSPSGSSNGDFDGGYVPSGKCLQDNIRQYRLLY